MATFSTTSRGKIKWEAPPQEASVSVKSAKELLIADDYKLLIADGHYLTIQSLIEGIAWSGAEKSTRNHWPAQRNTAAMLDIGGYALDIGSGYSLQVGDPDYSSSTEWTKPNRTGSWQW